MLKCVIHYLSMLQIYTDLFIFFNTYGDISLHQYFYAIIKLLCYSVKLVCQNLINYKNGLAARSLTAAIWFEHCTQKWKSTFYMLREVSIFWLNSDDLYMVSEASSVSYLHTNVHKNCMPYTIYST